MTQIGYHDLVDDSYRTCGSLRELLPCVTGAVVTDTSDALISIDLRLTPPLELQAHNYPVEQVRITQQRRTSQPAPDAVPIGPKRSWLHRNPTADGTPGGALCLWYPLDPSRLRWDWSKGFETFVLVVHRHLLTEESVRRGSPWPVEDAPHGHRPGGMPHPVLGDARGVQ
jgi:hypothetical protein